MAETNSPPQMEIKQITVETTIAANGDREMMFAVAAGVHAAETHKERVICKVACNIALERPLGEIGALLRGVAGDVYPRIAACTVFHAA